MPDELTYLVALENFDARVQEADLAGGVTIRRLSTDEREQLTFPTAGLRLPQPELEGFFLTVRPPSHVDEDQGRGTCRQLFDDTVTALRLTRAGDVFVGNWYELPAERSTFGLFPLGSRPLRRWLFRPRPYLLEEEDMPALTQLAERVGRAHGGPLRIAISRFNLSYMRDTGEDRFIDLWIAIEALFSPTDKMELRYRIALRVAHLIGKPGDEREEIYRTLLSSYNLRSDVVHGKKLTIRQPKDMKMSERKIVDRTEEYLRCSIRVIVLSDKVFDDNAAKSMDMAIARGHEGGKL